MRRPRTLLAACAVALLALSALAASATAWTGTFEPAARPGPKAWFKIDARTHSHLTRDGDRVIASGTFFYGTLLSGNCRERHEFEAVATGVHGLP